MRECWGDIVPLSMTFGDILSIDEEESWFLSSSISEVCDTNAFVIGEWGMYSLEVVG